MSAFEYQHLVLSHSADVFYLVKGLFRKALLCLKGTDMFAESLNVVVIAAFPWTADFVPPLFAFFFFF